MKNLLKLVSSLAIFAFLTSTAFAAHGVGIAVIQDDNKIDFENLTEADMQLSGLDFISPGGFLLPDADSNASPFTFMLSNTPNQVTFGNLGTTVSLAPHGSLELTTGYDVDGAVAAGATVDPATGVVNGDITGAWGDGPTPVEFAIRTTMGDAGGTVDPVPLVLGVVQLDNRIDFINNSEETASLSGLDFISPGGFLLPDPDENASPFTFMLANTPNQITFGNLGTTVQVAPHGTIELTAGYDVAAAIAAGATVDPLSGIVSGDLTAAWGNGPTPVAFPVAQGVVPEPTTALLSVFGILGLLGFRRRRN